MGIFEQLREIYEIAREENDEPQELPGIDRAIVSSRLGDAGVMPHPFLLDLYSWRNGIWHVNGFLHFPTLDESVQVYQGNLEFFGDRSKDIFPVLDNNGHVLLCFDVRTEDLVEIDPEMNQVERLGRLSDYLAAVREMLNVGAATYDENGGLFRVVDETAWKSAQERYRIKSAWW